MACLISHRHKCANFGKGLIKVELEKFWRKIEFKCQHLHCNFKENWGKGIQKITGFAKIVSRSNVFFPKPCITCQYILKRHIPKLANNQVFIKQTNKKPSLSNNGRVVGNGEKKKWMKWMARLHIKHKERDSWCPAETCPQSMNQFRKGKRTWNAANSEMLWSDAKQLFH